MAQIPFRANTQTMTFPLLSELSGQTIIVPQQDQTYVGGVSVPATASDGNSQVPADRGIPQIYYAHNVMPSTQGFQSIGYDLVYTGINWGLNPPTNLMFESTKLIQGGQVVSSVPAATGFKSYISIPKTGPDSVFILDPVTKQWKAVLGSPVITATTEITVATVNGVSYIFFSNIGAYIYDNNTNLLVSRPLAGLDVTKVIGLVASNGYLFAYKTDAVAWSSVVNVEDFVPSDVSGAGGGQVQEARGEIVTCRTTSLGLILYTSANAVSCIYSGNADFPWNFKHISSSGGISTSELVSEEQTGGFQQVYSTNGFQQIGHTGCRTISPQMTDFIAGHLFEDYDIATNTFSSIEFDWIMRKSLAVIADRYVVVSYGLYPDQDFTHAIVLDIAQNRMGKLRITHANCFELRSLIAQTTETPRGSIAFLQSNGDIRAVNFNFNAMAPDSVMFLGKYQYVRQRGLELHEVELENVKLGADFKLQAFPTLDGKNYTNSVEGFLAESEGNYRKFLFASMVGKNISLLFTGRFNIISLVLWFSTHGRP
jgi:hypothetical protein